MSIILNNPPAVLDGVIRVPGGRTPLQSCCGRLCVLSFLSVMPFMVTVPANAAAERARDGAGLPRRVGIAAAAAAIALLSTGTSEANSPRHGELELAKCISGAASGRPWLEKTLWGLRDQEGGWVGAEILNSDGSRDLGPLQINSWWVPVIARRMARNPDEVWRWLRDDPCFNVQAARWIFLSGLIVARDYWGAVGAYHSPSRRLQIPYAQGVTRRLTKRFGNSVFRTAERSSAGR